MTLIEAYNKRAASLILNSDSIKVVGEVYGYVIEDPKYPHGVFATFTSNKFNGELYCYLRVNAISKPLARVKDSITGTQGGTLFSVAISYKGLITSMNSYNITQSMERLNSPISYLSAINHMYSLFASQSADYNSVYFYDNIEFYIIDSTSYRFSRKDTPMTPAPQRFAKVIRRQGYSFPRFLRDDQMIESPFMGSYEVAGKK